MAKTQINAVAKPHRRPETGGYPRGQETRLRLLTTAIEVFGRAGYEQASTREIATRAGVNPPALQYYFNNKYGLYIACIDNITESIKNRIEPFIQEIDIIFRGNPSKSELIEFYCRFQESLIDSFQSSQEGRVIRPVLTWETASETSDARKLMRDRAELPIMRVVFRIVGSLLGKSADDLEIRIHAFALTGMFRTFHTDALRTQSLLGWDAEDPANAALLKSILRVQSTALLENLAAAYITSTATERAVSPNRH